MSFSFSQKSLNRMSGVNPILVDVAKRAIQLTRIDFGIPEHGGLRTAEEQKLLYDQKVSRADGYTNRSNHQSGNALDFYAYVNGQASWEIEHLAQVAAAFLQAAIELNVRIRWGGLWHSWQDNPHVELING